MILNIIFILLFYILFSIVKITHFLVFLLSSVGIHLSKIFARKNSILYIENFPVENAGYQYRAEKWAKMFRQNGYKAKIRTLIKDKKKFEKFDITRVRYLSFLLISIIKKYCIVLSSIRYERVIVRRELLFYNDYGKMFMVKLLLCIKPDAILDFDDDISAAKKEPRLIINWFGKILREHPAKFSQTLQLFSNFIVGSEYLKNLILGTNFKVKPANICVIPTCVDYDRYTQKQYFEKDEIVFGWIGGNGNLILLENILDALEKIAKVYKIKLLVISGRPIQKEVSFPVEFRPWSLDTEVDDIYGIDIGLMPLANTRIARGKCGFKLLQYMGLGIVSVASAITVNIEIVEDGVDSYLVEPEGDWEEIILKVLKTKNFQQIGNNAKAKIHNYYTFTANFNKYSQYLKTLCAES